MTAALTHTIVPATDKAASSEFLARILGVPPAKPWGPFLVLALDNGVSLDFEDAHEVHAHHYAFLVDEAEFDRSSNGSKTLASRSSPIRSARSRAVSTTSTAVGASTSTTRTATTWRSSPSPTAPFLRCHRQAPTDEFRVAAVDLHLADP
jgi:hypothetical protein